MKPHVLPDEHPAVTQLFLPSQGWWVDLDLCRFMIFPDCTNIAYRLCHGGQGERQHCCPFLVQGSKLSYGEPEAGGLQV